MSDYLTPNYIVNFFRTSIEEIEKNQKKTELMNGLREQLLRPFSPNK